jgi:hypothetical protein
MGDNDATCVTTALALSSKKENDCCWIKDWYKGEAQYIHENLTTVSMLRQPND